MGSGAWLVVLTWNGRDDTLELLESIKGISATVLVVDNNSSDGTLDAVEAGFPTVRRLQTGANLGYAGGNNAGISLALAHGAEVITVLNNDTIADPSFLEPMLAALEKDPELAVSPDIRYAAEPEVSWFRGSKIDRRTAWPQHLQPDEQAAVDVALIDTPLLTGCCVAATARTWRNVGLFDDGLFLMFEDSDWSMRAKDAGVRLGVVPASRIGHKVSRSFTGTSSLLGSYYFARNGAIFASRHLGWPATARFALRQVIRPSLRPLLDRERRASAIMSWLGLLAAASPSRGAAGRVASGYAQRAQRRRAALTGAQA